MSRRKVLAIMIIMVLAIGGAVIAQADGSLELDISQGDIVISESGASVGGTAADAALNPAGYRIINSSGAVVANNITINVTSAEVPVELDSVQITVNNKACVDIMKDSKVNLTLTDCELIANASNDTIAKAAVAMGVNTEVTLNISGSNRLIADFSAGVGLKSNAKLTVEGGNTDTLLAQGGGAGAGIGNPSATQTNNTVITINGGNITAIGGEGEGGGGACSHGIGGFAKGTNNQIIINGGIINASTANVPGAFGIGYGMVASISPAIEINGGSVNCTVQGTPENSAGEALRQVTVTCADKPNCRFVFINADGEAWTDNDGKMYLYLPTTLDQLAATCDDVAYLGDITGDPAAATLTVDTSDPCSCDSTNAGLDFPDQAITVYTVVGSDQFKLAAVFNPSADCTALHPLKDMQYELLGGVADTVAKINGDVLTVFAAADGQTLQVQAQVKVNGQTYTKTANFVVSTDPSYVFDLADGDIIVENTSVKVGSNTHNLADASAPVRIVQSMSATTSTTHTITISDGVNKNVIIKDLNMARPSDSRLNYSMVEIKSDAKLNLTLEGTNIITEGATNTYPAIHLIGAASQLTIDGDGTLDVTGGAGTPAIGGKVSDAIGHIIIENGRIIAHGGSGAAGLGAGKDSDFRNAQITINGGLVLAKGGAGSPRDLKAKVVINGGSVAGLDAAGAVIPQVRFYNTDVAPAAGETPKNTAGVIVYPVELTVENNEMPDKAVNYYLKVGAAAEGTAIPAYTDSKSKLYLYLPVAGDYYSVRVNDPDVGTDYYKRIKVSADADNSGILVKDSQVAIILFRIPGQTDAVIDNVNHTVTVTMPTGIDITSLRPTIDAGGAEYTPTGAVNFTSPQTYKLINDKGEEIEYTVTVNREALAPGQKTVLNIADGDILMQGDNNITVGGIKIEPNASGYIITGESSEHMLYMANVSAPVTLKDLTISAPQPTLDCAFSAQNVELLLEGVNTVIGAENYPAMWLVGDRGECVSIDGEGMLTLQGGQNSPALQRDDVGIDFVIKGGNVFIVDGKVMRPGEAIVPVDEAGDNVYPLVVTIDAEDMAWKTVKYSDTPVDASGNPNTGLPALTDKEVMTNGEGKISIFRPLSNYDLVIKYGANDENICYGGTTADNSAQSLSPVTVGLPKIKELTFKAPDSSLAKDVEFTLSGDYLTRYMTDKLVVSATDSSGNKLSATATATAVAGSDEVVWKATISVPANDTENEITYTLSATAEGRDQTLTGTTSFLMRKVLKIKSVTLPGYQIGDAEIGMNTNGRGYVNITVPYDLDLAAGYKPIIDYTGVRYNPTTVRQFTSPVEYIIYNYQVYEETRDSVKYDIALVPQTAPQVGAISFTNPDYNGGDVDIKLTGSNLESILQAATADGSKIVVKLTGLSGQEWYLTKDDIQNGKDTVTVTVPSNAGGLDSKEFPVHVIINGVDQVLTGTEADRTITVPGELEMNPQIKSFSFGNQLTYTDVEGSKKLDLDNAVFQHANINDNWTIDIKVPWRTELASLNPHITMVNSQATYKFVDAGGRSYTNMGDAIPSGNPETVSIIVRVQPVTGNTKDYTLTITRVATDLEQDATIKSFSFGKAQLPEYNAKDGEELGFDKAVIVNGDTKYGAGSISIAVPWTTNLKTLIPNIKLTYDDNDAVYFPTGTIDFSAPATITVRAVNGQTKDYLVTVTPVATELEKNSGIRTVTVENQLGETRFELNGKNGLPRFTITMPGGTDLKALKPQVELTNPDSTYKPHTPQDFSQSAANPVVYTVTSVDGKESQYEVVITIKRSSGNKETNITYDTETVEVTPYVNGYEDGLFRPEASITRAEAAAMLARTSEDYDADETYRTAYADIPAGAWYGNFVGFLSGEQIVKGSDKNLFMPERDITRMEFAAMLARYAKLDITKPAVEVSFKDIKGAWGEKEILALAAKGAIGGYEDGSFRPNEPITRAEAVTMLNGILERPGKDLLQKELAKAEPPFRDVPEKHWAYEDIWQATARYTVTTDTRIVGSSEPEVTQKLTMQNK